MILLENVSKSFGELRAVQDMSFELNAGEVVGFLGVNGAGKSTTMRMMTGYLVPDSGRISVCGHDIQAEGVAARRCLGYLPENAPVYGEMRVRDFLAYCGGLRGMRGAALDERIGEVVQLCGLEGVIASRIETLSKGYVHRTCLAQALIHEPAGLVLDEPTDGLDPIQKRGMQELIRTMGRTKAIVVSTHILEEVEAVCTRVIIIEHGQLKLDARIEDVRGHLYDYFAEGRSC